jgi:hypothetical protein
VALDVQYVRVDSRVCSTGFGAEDVDGATVVKGFYGLGDSLPSEADGLADLAEADGALVLLVSEGLAHDKEQHLQLGQA